MFADFAGWGDSVLKILSVSYGCLKAYH